MTTFYDPTTDLSDLEPGARARSLLCDLAEVESELRPLERQKAAIRDALAVALEGCEGRRYTLPGYGVAKLAEPAVVRQWSTERLARLCAWLRETERDEIAEMIESCREETTRAGGLRIEPDRAPARVNV